METIYSAAHHTRYYGAMLVPYVIVSLLIAFAFKLTDRFASGANTWPAVFQTMYGLLRTSTPYLLGYVLLFFVVYFGSSFAAFAQESATNSAEVKATLARVVTAHRLPAAGVAIVSSGGVQALEVTGVRKKGENVAVTADDLWHLGSNGKAMTAAMVARLVERGAMRWEQTLAETFPELAQSMSPEAKTITIAHLLSHRSGIDANFDLGRYFERRDLQQARLEVLKDALAAPLKSKPGDTFLYSNWGYTVASAMAERATKKPFETLMREEVFAPLAMTSAGFQGTGTPGKIDQPWPHGRDGSPSPENGPGVDNAPTMAAAGTMHMTLGDYAKFIREIMNALKGKSAWIKKDTAEKLTAPAAGDYALGWRAVERGWAQGRALNHAGDNTMNFAMVWIGLNIDRAMLFVSNQSGAFRAADDTAIATLVKPAQEKK